MKIAIDPDCNKSGIAIIENGVMTLDNLDLFDLYEYLKANKPTISTVIIEGAKDISFNFTSKFMKGSKAAIATANNRVGANKEIGNQIELICKKIGLNYRVARPLKKQWGVDKQGKPKKISHEQFVKIWQVSKILHEKHRKQTNQEQRDAALFLV